MKPSLTLGRVVLGMLGVSVAVLGATLAARGALAANDTATGVNHGCYRVTTSAINIRAKPFASADIISRARNGDIVLKWKRFCTLRGYWCPVEKDGIRGHADKAHLQPVPCSALPGR